MYQGAPTAYGYSSDTVLDIDDIRALHYAILVFQCFPLAWQTRPEGRRLNELRDFLDAKMAEGCTAKLRVR